MYTDSVFRYFSFGIFSVFTIPIPKENSVSIFGILKLAGASNTRGVLGGASVCERRARKTTQLTLSSLSLSFQCTHVVRDRASTCEGKPRRLLRECQNSLGGRLQLTSSLSLSSLSLSSQCTHVVHRWCAGWGGGFSACERGETKAPS